MSRCWASPGGPAQGAVIGRCNAFSPQCIPWATLFWVFFRQHVYRAEDVYLLVGDEVVVTKAGKTTHGLDRFFASLYGKPVPGLAFFALSLVSTQQRRSFPIRVEQVVRSDAEKAASKAKAAAKKRHSVTPSGVLGVQRAARTPPKPTATLTPELVRITACSTPCCN